MTSKVCNVGCGEDKYGTHRIDIKETKATTEVYDIELGLPYKNNFFDEIYAKCVFEHMKNPHNLLLEMKRVCKAEGKIIIITDNAGFVGFHLPGHYHGGANEVNLHYALYTEEHLKNHLQAAGLKLISLNYGQMDLKDIGFIKMTFQYILGLLGKRFGRARIIIEATK